MKIIENRMLMFIAATGIFAGCGSKPSASDPDAQVEMEMETRPDMALPPPDMGIPSDSYVPSCGNGVRDLDEACDEGENNSGTTPNACRTDCTLPFCGDAVTDLGEQCDEGKANAFPWIIPILPFVFAIFRAVKLLINVAIAESIAASATNRVSATPIVWCSRRHIVTDTIRSAPRTGHFAARVAVALEAASIRQIPTGRITIAARNLRKHQQRREKRQDSVVNVH